MSYIFSTINNRPKKVYKNKKKTCFELNNFIEYKNMK